MQSKQIIGYQIYLKSFYDGLQTGQGNIQGLIEKLPYLADLGINLIWLCPIYDADMIDAGYDVKNYFEIHAGYGTLNDFKEFIQKAKSLKIEVMMDLVINHLSTNSIIFQKAKQSRNNPEYDFFIWSDQPDVKQQSYFGESAWEFNKQTNSYYFHLFAINQADLNWDNPKVRAYIQEVIQFWIDLGVTYFRLDAFEHVGKTITPFAIKYGEYHYQYMNELAQKVFIPNQVHVYAEAWSLTKEVAKQFTNCHHQILEGFFFSGLHDLDWRRKNGAYALVKNRPVFKDLQKVYQYFELDGSYINSWTNHDTPRAISRYFQHNLHWHYYQQTMMHMFLMTNKGIPFFFQGEEFGMLNPKYENWQDYPDLTLKDQYNGRVRKRHELTHMQFEKAIKTGARALSRSIICWDNQKPNLGFSAAEKIWSKPGQNVNNPDLAKDLQSKQSLVFFLKKLIAIRKQKRMEILTSYSRFKIIHFSNEFAIVRLSKGNEKVQLEFNFTNQTIAKSKVQKMKLILSNYETTDNDKLQPYEARIYKS